MKTRGRILLISLMACAVTAAVFRERVVIAATMVKSRFVKKTVADRLTEFGAAARGRMKDDFARASAGYPPRSAILLVLKQERRMELYVGGNRRYVRSWPILAASGVAGPKLREGDRQVPEGIYRIESLNPNSSYHVSLRLNYPNEFDRAQAHKESRTNLGGDIMIHGKSVSVGCIALGDRGAEEVFTLATDVGLDGITVISSPVDWRTNAAPSLKLPAWTDELYAQIKSQMAALQSPGK